MPLFFGDERSYLERRDVVTEEGVTSVRLVPGKLQDGIASEHLAERAAGHGSPDVKHHDAHDPDQGDQ